MLLKIIKANDDTDFGRHIGHIATAYCPSRSKHPDKIENFYVAEDPNQKRREV